MKASSRTWLLLLLELSLFVVDHQAPVLYVWHVPAAEMEILGTVAVNDKKTLSPWKRNTLPEQESPPTSRPIRSAPPQHHNSYPLPKQNPPTKQDSKIIPSQQIKYLTPPLQEKDRNPSKKVDNLNPPLQVKDRSPSKNVGNLTPHLQVKDGDPFRKGKNLTTSRQSKGVAQPQQVTDIIPSQDVKDLSPQQQENKRDISLEDILIEDDHRRGASRVTVRPKKKAHKDLKTQDSGWPNGTYGLPRASSGCPSGMGFQWKTGFRFQDTEDDFTDNQKSDSYHLAGKVSDDGIRQEFCMKTNPYGHRNWPDGKYCIYRKGEQCPHGLESGFVIWDDENKDNKDTAEGTLPDGRYSEDTKIFFCCSVTGDWDEPIVLPTDRPFYLFAYGSNKCQKVAGMEAVSEFVKFDDQDRGNTDYEGGFYPYGINKGSKDHTIFFCYYAPIDKVWDSIVEIAPMPSLRKSDHKSSGYKSKPKEKKKKIDKLEEMEKLRSSKKMMDAFLAATSQHREETDKSERTKTIIKTIRVPERVKDSTTTIVATTMGVVLGVFLLGSIVLLIVSRHIRKRHKIDTMDDHDITFSSRRSSFATSDDEIELTEGDFEDELVEDQYLPSDSELKSGLELMFLKQQRHYWTKNKKP